jgi:hypothetical protein
MNIAAIAQIEPEPIEIDSRPCADCGLTIDQHRRIDTFEGPEFFCEDIEVQIHLDAAAMRDRWEADDTPRASPASTRKPYSTPQATIDAFWCVVRLDDPNYLTRWLEQHPLDASALCKLWEGRNAS